MKNPIKIDDLGIPVFLETSKYIANPVVDKELFQW